MRDAEPPSSSFPRGHITPEMVLCDGSLMLIVSMVPS